MNRSDNTDGPDREDLWLRISDLTLRLEEAEDALRAIRRGEVDAVVVKDGEMERIYTLSDVDQVYRSIIENMTEGALIVQSSSFIVYANRRATELVNVPLEKLIGSSFDDHIRPDDRPVFQRLIETKRACGTSHGEIALAVHNGTELPVLVSISRLDPSSLPDACIVNLTDISELRAAQVGLQRSHAELELRVQERTESLLGANAALRDSEERFRGFAEGMPHIVWEADPEGRATYVNELWYRYTGRDTKAGPSDDWLSYYHPEDRAAVSAAWTASIGSGGVVPHDLEARIRRHDGVYRWFRITGAPIRGEDGTVKRWVGTCTDIHDRKLAEEQLIEANRRKDEFLAMLAHELRNPLAPVRNAVQVLRRLGSPTPALERPIDMIDRQVAHMVRLIDDLMDVSRITRGKISLQRETVAVSSVVSSAVEACLPLIEARRHQLELVQPDASLRVFGDSTRLTQVVQNLLNNAAKYTREGGHIRLTVERNDTTAAVRVSDNGEGIPTELLPRIFDLFIQADQTLSRSSGGLGIGLTLVKSLVEMHGGTVQAASGGIGRGSEFTVRLPLLDETRPEPGNTQIQIKISKVSCTTPLHILVADDHEDAAESLAMMLRILGHEVQTVYDGTRAVQAATASPFDVAVLDIGMPGLSGYEVARRLRCLTAGRGTVLVALTGWGQEHDKRRAAEAGFDYHFTKPVSPFELEKLLASLAMDRASLDSEAEG